MERDPVAIVSKPIYGPRFGVGMLALVALFSFGLGVASGGIILPFLRSAAPETVGSAASSPTKSQSEQALLSVLPQSILAELDTMQGPLATNLSVEQYLNEIEVRASQAGFTAARSFQSLATGSEIGYVFKPGPAVKAGTAALPETLVLRFQTGPQMGTLVLAEMRRDGVVQSAGTRFVDLVRAGASMPVLPETQLLTARGLLEIKTSDGGAAAYLDGVLIYPRDAHAKGQAEVLVPEKIEDVTPKQPAAMAWPQKISIQGVWPTAGVLPELAVLVAGDNAPKPCSARAILVDLRRGTKLVLEERLQGSSLRPEVRARGLALAGFCPTVSRRVVAEGAPAPQPSQSVAFYDIRSGQVRWETSALTVEASPPSQVPAWREPSINRIASPLGQKGALASVACRAGGGYTIAVSGLPGPTKGTTASIRLSSGGKTASQLMNWKPSAIGYEVDGKAESVAADPFLARFGTGQPLEFSANGASMTISALPPSQLEGLIAKCQKPKAD